MAKEVPALPDRRDLIDRYLTSFGLLIKELCPEAEIDISPVRYEDEDAHIRVFPPASITEQERDRLADRLADRTVEILNETGLLILTGVYEPAQRPQR